MKLIQKLLFLSIAFVTINTVSANKVTDTLDTAFDSIETAFNNIDRAFHSTDTAFDRFTKSVDRVFKRAEKTIKNTETRVKLRLEIAHDHQIVDHCERAFATSAAIGLVSALGGCPLAPLFCAGAKIAGGLLAGAYIKLYVDKAAYKGTEIF